MFNPFTADPVKALHFAYWSNPPFLIFDIRALWRGLSARAPECQKIKKCGLDQYGAEPFEQQQFGTAGVEGLRRRTSCSALIELRSIIVSLSVSLRLVPRPYVILLCI